MKRCLNIDPKEYTECDGEFYTHSENVTERRRKDYNDLTRHELISERKGLLQRLEKLQNFKDKTERYVRDNLTIKLKSGDVIEVISGLEEGQEIVVSGQFLIDSESSLRADFQRMETGDNDL